jgi:hypothetical protein
MNPIQVAIYARVSSEQQAEAHTVASQVVALRERVAADDLPVSRLCSFWRKARKASYFPNNCNPSLCGWCLSQLRASDYFD